ncbi:MAG: nicotinamide-nucleotide amidohydrolase family protein [Lentisphaerae bacterium]|nr:nicotinamide-nucleotide amidohydrolase family protein [Lentisphaerota bacterium]
MSIAVICTGTELLKGGCCNIDMQLLGAKLAGISQVPVMELSIGDHADELYFALSSALKIADTLIISGGLGPTADDITLHTVARFFGVELQEVPELKEKVKKCWMERHNSHCPKFQYKQALIVKGGRYFDNPAGVASGIGFQVSYGGKMRRIYLLPGPPSEFETVLNNGVLDDIAANAEEKLYTSGFFVCGVGEVSAARTVEELLQNHPVELAYTAMPGGTKLFISGKDSGMVNAATLLANQALAPNALEPGFFDLPSALLKKLSDRQYSFGCAESCTGGVIADLIVSLPGASTIFKGGIVSYANEIKNSLLNVPENILETYGAVSKECALAMVQGACTALNCQCAVSTTGIAGPDGGTPEKPVGLVYVAASVNGLTASRELHLRGNRRMIRERAAAGALQLLWELLNVPENSSC